MAKPLPLFIGVLGVGATATGGILLMGKKGSGEGTSTTSTSSSTGGGTGGTVGGTSGGSNVANGGGGGSSSGSAQSADLLFDTVDKFKQNAATNSECVKDYFDGIDLNPSTSPQEINDTNKTEAEKIFKASAGGEAFTPFKSCLIVNWKKSVDSSTNKWNGKFTWLWTFIRGDEGFINFNVMEPSSTDGKVKFTGLFYLVQKTTGNSPKWEVKFKKEVTDKNKEVAKANVAEHFPKSSSTLKTSASLSNDYWGYVEDPSKLDEMCNEGDTCKTAPEVKKFQWTADTNSEPASTSKPLKEWSENLTWWEKIYGVKNQWNLEEKVKNFKGTWTKVEAS